MFWLCTIQDRIFILLPLPATDHNNPVSASTTVLSGIHRVAVVRQALGPPDGVVLIVLVRRFVRVAGAHPFFGSTAATVPLRHAASRLVDGHHGVAVLVSKLWIAHSGWLLLRVLFTVPVRGGGVACAGDAGPL